MDRLLAMRIVGIAGSLRKGSYNAALLRAAVDRVPSGAEILVGSIQSIPLYDGDYEASEGIPAHVAHLKGQLIDADALLLVTPEYNHSLPGVLKNAIDWLSRPPKDIPRVFGDLPVGLIGATPGSGGTRFAQTAWLPVFRTLGMRPWFGKQLYVSNAKRLFDEDMHLVDRAIEERLIAYLAGFCEFLNAAPRSRR